MADMSSQAIEPTLAAQAGVAGPPSAAEPQPGAAVRVPSMRFLVASLAGGNTLAMGLSMIAGVLSARLVAPSTLGLLSGIGLVIAYAPFLQLGIVTGINRELPYFIGKRDYRRVNELAAAAQAWALVLAGVVCFGLLTAAGWELARGELKLAAGCLANAILALFLFYSTLYLQSTYRSSHDFARLAFVSVAQSIASLAFLVLVALWDFYGLCLRSVLAGAVGAALLHYWRPVRVGPHWNSGHLKHLLTIGLPIFAVNQFFLLWTPINSSLVLAYAGTEGLGLYAVVMMAGNALDILPAALSQVVYPRMSEQYGRTERLSDLIRMTWRPMAYATAGMIPMIAVGEFLVGPFVQLVIPKYVGALPAVRWIMLMPLLTCLGAMSMAFPVVRRQPLNGVAVVLGLASYYGCLMWLLRGGVSLAAFAQAMLLGRVVYVILSSVFLTTLVRREKRDAGIPNASIP
ncbi:MAG: oligosaccharide flippase family protein [Thermoguttaceae bacterium]|jgi:O-antigen/teichoic acid export membrane protein